MRNLTYRKTNNASITAIFETFDEIVLIIDKGESTCENCVNLFDQYGLDVYDLPIDEFEDFIVEEFADGDEFDFDTENVKTLKEFIINEFFNSETV